MVRAYSAAASRTLLLVLWISAQAFAFVCLGQRRTFSNPNLLAHSTSFEFKDRLDVVLFGLGDLRLDDHIGIQTALAESGSKILPIVVLDPLNLAKLPVAHAGDTADMIAAALTDLKESLLQLELDLHVSVTTLEETLQDLKLLSGDVHIHVCDLDPVDNSLGYGPFSLITDRTNVHTWNCHLRDEPWNLVGMTNSYTDYQQRIKNVAVRQPLETPRDPVPIERRASCAALSTTVPTCDMILQLIHRAIPSLDPQRVQQEKGTGIFGTHWGGVPSTTVGEQHVWQAVQDYTEVCQEDDEQWARHERYVGRSYQRKVESLEHASMAWMMRGDGSASSALPSLPVTQNMIAGESMTRYLAAPLWLGTISPRRIWHAAVQAPFNPFYQSALQCMVEGREWHKLLATIPSEPDGLEYGYWRWHGFLCRYARKDLRATAPESKSGLLLVHGFGASSSQWKRSVDVLLESPPTSVFDQVLAPDLIGFGRSEKPALTYTQYLWSGYVGDFVKEIGIAHEKWESFVVGGNSIGGYTSMSVAADDSVTGEGAFSSLGAPGSNRCSGLTLFNTAGKIQTQEEIMAVQESGDDFVTVAQLTAQDGLSACKPAPRPIARIFGNGLLAYLRPNIQQICKNVYPINPDAADEQLCRNILRDSLDPGAVNVMISGSKLPIPRTANEILGADIGSGSDEIEGIFRGPVLVAQGMLDPLNDAKGRAAMLGSLREGITVAAINGGHCPHDEVPRESMGALVQWARQIVRTVETLSHRS
ncbi:hypothetical protein MHU86_9722 [Fragilaria crotonensis]|nr:hypothetical protein MHU86_9722 [Fragilaria crotonensis]